MILDILCGGISLVSRHLFQETFGCGLTAVYAEFLHGLPCKSLAIFLIDYYKISRIAYAVYLLTEEFGAEAMDGAYEIVDTASIHHAGYAPLHLLSGLVGECETKDITRAYTDIVYDKSISVGKHPGLAGTGTRHHPHTSFRGLHGLLLPIV